MGEAKRKLELMRQTMIRRLEEWTFPPSEWEARMVEEIQRLPVSSADRLATEKLAMLAMEEQQCHENASRMERLDPLGLCRRLTGWLVENDNFVLHSLVERTGRFHCVTPVPHAADGPLHFIADPALKWQQEGDLRRWYRGGHPIGVGLRSNPTKTIKDVEVEISRLRSRMQPYRAT